MNYPCDNMHRGIRVWVVDDDADCRLLVRDAIGTAGDWQINEINDSSEALTLLRRAAANPQQRPDVIVLDVNMPGPSGLDVLRVAKSDPALVDISIVMLTGATDPGLRPNAWTSTWWSSTWCCWTFTCPTWAGWS